MIPTSHLPWHHDFGSARLSLTLASTPSARIDASASIDRTAHVGPGAVIGSETTVAGGVAIHANAVVGARCRLDEGVRIMANATLYDDVKVGARSVVHANAVIGADGFGFARSGGGALAPIAQLGGVTLGKNVSIGAATTVDRGAIDDTLIEDGVKIDNQVQIGHNCRIGAHSVICGCVGIVGSTEIGRGCVLAGMVGVRRGSADPHLRRGDRQRLHPCVAVDHQARHLLRGRHPQRRHRLEAQRPALSKPR